MMLLNKASSPIMHTPTMRGMFLARTTISPSLTGSAISRTGTANIYDYGAVGDDVANDLPSVLSALAALKEAALDGILQIPPGGFFFNGPVNLHQTVHIEARGAYMRFPPNSRGIVFHEYRTTDDGGGLATATGFGDAAFSTMEGGTLWGGMAGSLHGPYTNPIAIDPTSHGIEVRTNFVRIGDVRLLFFSGHGLYCHAFAGYPGPDQGNASINKFDNIVTFYNQRFGIYLLGSDANTCVVTGGSDISNGGGGYGDESFLGNTCTGRHVRDCGTLDPNHGDAPVACCTYQGNTYYVKQGMHDAAATTVPGTDANVWVPRWGIAAYEPWVPGRKWCTGGSFIIGTNNQGNSS